MPSGLFSQTVCFLLSQPISLDSIEALLTAARFSTKRTAGTGHWANGENALIVSLDEAENAIGSETGDETSNEVESENDCKASRGQWVIDLFEHLWPDDMGHPEKTPEIFNAWSQGHFGRGTYPQSLVRAAQHSYFWAEAAERIPQHTAVLRIRANDADAPTSAENSARWATLDTAMQCVTALSQLDGVICYFNPSGEVVRPLDHVTELIAAAKENVIRPIDLWSNVRMYGIDSQWSLMDTIGNRQFNVSDIEAVFQSGRYNPNEVAAFLRNISFYFIETEKEVSDGDTFDGPGNLHWIATQCEKPLAEPPRAIIRLSPDDGEKPPEIEVDS